jgi:hypothetical protein
MPPQLYFKGMRSFRNDPALNCANATSDRLPTISAEKPVVPYIQKTKQGAKLNPSMLINPEIRKLANGGRTVEDPVMVKAKAAKVCTHNISLALAIFLL